MKINRTPLVAAILGALVPALLDAQAAKKPYLSSDKRALTAPELLDAPDERIGRSLKWADDILLEIKRAVVEHPARRAALIRLDDVLHIKTAPA